MLLILYLINKFTVPAAFVINTDVHNLPGSHWVALYIDNKYTCYFFDSYGFPPLVTEHKQFIVKNTKKIIYNKTCLQSTETSVCGHYCSVFVLLMCRKIKFNTVISRLNLKNKYDNDANIIILYARFFSKNKSGGRRSKSCSLNSQCCVRKPNCK